MAKGARASSRKENNRRLKKDVFGPVEEARAERLSAKLIEIANQPKPEMEGVDFNMDQHVEDGDSANKEVDEAKMDVDSAGKGLTKKTLGRKRVEKRRKLKSRIVFPKYSDRNTKVKKR